MVADDPIALDGRLLWRCRRGMKELDLVLTGYLKAQWQSAGAAERACFERVLDLPDPMLAAFLTGRERATDPQLQSFIERLRRGVENPP